jgi:hypothetical protein
MASAHGQPLLILPRACQHCPAVQHSMHEIAAVTSSCQAFTLSLSVPACLEVAARCLKDFEEDLCNTHRATVSAVDMADVKAPNSAFHI